MTIAVYAAKNTAKIVRYLYHAVILSEQNALHNGLIHVLNQTRKLAVLYAERLVFKNINSLNIKF